MSCMILNQRAEYPNYLMRSLDLVFWAAFRNLEVLWFSQKLNNSVLHSVSMVYILAVVPGKVST